MFFIKKKNKLTKNGQKILDAISNLSARADIFENERIILERAKSLIENGEYFPNVLKRLENTLRPLALRSELSNETSKFYVGISRMLISILPLGSNPNSLAMNGQVL